MPDELFAILHLGFKIAGYLQFCMNGCIVVKYTCRGVSGEWAIAHQVFGRIEGAAKRWRGGSGAPHYYLPTQF